MIQCPGCRLTHITRTEAVTYKGGEKLIRYTCMNCYYSQDEPMEEINNQIKAKE